MSGHRLELSSHGGQVFAGVCSCDQWSAGGMSAARVIERHDAHRVDVGLVPAGQGTLFAASSQAGLASFRAGNLPVAEDNSVR